MDSASVRKIEVLFSLIKVVCSGSLGEKNQRITRFVAGSRKEGSGRDALAWHQAIIHQVRELRHVVGFMRCLPRGLEISIAARQASLWKHACEARVVIAIAIQCWHHGKINSTTLVRGS
jgi:hypothetical protein